MKAYPSIQGINKILDWPCIAFRKYDGLNIRVEYSEKAGFYKFGTRHCLLDESNKQWGGCVNLFNETIANKIEKVIKDNKLIQHKKNIIVFCEVYSKSSFAGSFPSNNGDRKSVV